MTQEEALELKPSCLHAALRVWSGCVYGCGWPRPCSFPVFVFIRAFNDAKDYKKDDGKVLDGTKSSTADDFVSKGEFRFLNAYLCIYAAMVRRALLVELYL